MQARRPGSPRSAPLISLALVVACGQAGAGYYDGASDAGAGGLPECFTSNECPTGWTCTEFGTCIPPAPGGPDGGASPEETEMEISQPISSLRYVYVAMTEIDSLARIDGATLEVSSLAVGDQPKELATIPGTDAVVVLDSNNGTATVVHPLEDGDDTSTVATLPHLNRISVDPSGTFAVAWFDLVKAISDAGGINQVGQIGSFQDVTLIRLPVGQQAAVDLTVGFRPREVEFDAAGTRAFVVTDDGVSVVALTESFATGPGIVSPIPISDDPLADPVTIEADVVANGDFAVVREASQSEIRVVRLTGDTAGQLQTIPLPAEPSDVDLAPGGDRAFVVLRDSSQLAIVDIPGDADDPSGVELVELGDLNVGSLALSQDGNRAILYTNAVEEERFSIIDLVSDGYPFTTHRLQKSVRAVGFDGTGNSAIIVHAKAFGDPGEQGITFDDFIDRSYAYSLIDIATGFDKLQITPVDPGMFVFSGTGNRAYITLDGGDTEGAIAQTHIIETDTGVVREVGLTSPPETVGILPAAGVAFVNQRHGLGRVSFIEIDTDAVRTVTGFDLNSQIVD